MGRRVEAMAAVCEAAIAWVEAESAYYECQDIDEAIDAYARADSALVEAVKRLLPLVTVPLADEEGT